MMHRKRYILKGFEHCGCNLFTDIFTADSSSEESSDDEIELTWMDELNRKQEHPERLHRELWFNEKDEVSRLHNVQHCLQVSS